MLGQKNKTHIVVGKDDNLATSSETRANLIAGQIGVFKNGSAVATASALSAGDKFKVVYMNTDGYIIESPMYDYSLLLNKKAVTYVAGTEQKTYVGYNGSAGSIVANNSDVYHIHITRKDSSATLAEHGLFKLAAAYESDASATQTEIADALILNLVKNFEAEKLKSGITVTKVGRINSAAVTAANDFTGDATVVIGTKTVSIAESGNNNDAGVYGAGNADLAVGDYLRIGTVGGATALTSQVYKVVALSGAKTTAIVATLDRPVLEASGTYAAATHDIEVIPSASVANWGLSFESAPVKFIPGLFKYQNVTFKLSLSEAFGNTLITDATLPTKGTGTYKEVAELEWELRGNRGEGYKVASYPVSQNLNATLGKTYAVISLDFANDNSKGLDGNVRSWHSLLIATETDSSSTVHTALKTVLNIS
jgi:hypothetical protein